jgi:hypothetical protein
MLRVVLALALVGLTLWALLDLLQTPAREVGTAPKPVWLALVLLLPVFGALAWIVLGRTERSVAPDDDPDFLRGIDEQRRQHPDGTT